MSFVTDGTVPMRARSERIASLDVLRGVALFGMLIVHFCALGIGTDEEDGLARFVSLFLENRFFTMFAILFGASFAVQLQRAVVKGSPLVPAYLRRLAALGVFGLVAEIGLGYRVLLPYAISGLALLAVRKWSSRALLILAIGVALALSTYQIGRTALSEARNGHSFARAELKALAVADHEHFDRYLQGKQSSEWRVVLATRVDDLRWFFTRPMTVFSYALPCFLLGVVAFRRQVFDQPKSQRRLITVAAIFGMLSWVIAEWILPRLLEPGPVDTASSATTWVAKAYASAGLGVFTADWLALTYSGGILLLIARDVAWVHRLSPFGWVGRMALTNYFLHIILLDLLFTPHGAGIQPPRLLTPVFAVAVFALDALFSRWWLSRHRYGPLESLWRVITHWNLAAIGHEVPPPAGSRPPNTRCC